MSNPATLREQRRRKTKAHLLDEIASCEQRVAALETLLASEEKFRHAFETAGHGMNLTAPDGRMMAVNGALCEMLGYTEEELLATDIRSTTHPDDIDRDLANLQALLAGEIPSYQLEKRYVHKQGQPIDVVLSVSLIRDSNGEPLYSVGHIQDIGERKRAERAAAEAEARLTDAIENISEGFALYDPDGRLVLCNGRYKEFYGYSDAEVPQGVSFEDLVRLDIEKGTVAEDGDGGPGHFEKRVEERHRTEGSFDLRLSDGRCLNVRDRRTAAGGVVSTQSDVTELRQFEQALSRSEERYALAMRGSNEGLWDWDLRADKTYISPHIRELLGVQAGQLEVTSAEWEARIHPDDLEGHLMAERAYREGEAEFYDCEYRVLGRDGAYRWVRDRGVGLRDEAGKVYRMAGSMGNITARKRAEQELARKDAQLRVALDNMPGGIRSVDKDGSYVFFNARYLELYDFPKGLLKVGESYRVENLYQAERGDFGLGDPEALTEEWLDSRSRETAPQSWERTTAAGKVLHVWTAPTPDGGFVNIVTDITERKRAEEELKESRERLQALADNLQVALSSMSDGIYILDGDLNFVAFNQRYVDLLNFPEGLVREGGSIADVTEFAAKRGDYGGQFDGDIDDVVASRLKQLKSDEEYLIENISPTGRIVEYRGSPIKGGGFVSIMHDITERKRAEEALKDSETLFRTFIDNTPAQIYMKDREGRHVLVNRRVEESIGRPVSDIIGKTSAEIYPGELAREYEEHDKHVLATGETDARELDMGVADGTARPHLIVKFPVLDAEGSISGVGSYATDITERKQAEEALREHEQLLETILDHMPTPVFLRDLDGRFMLINRSYEDIHRVTKDGVRGKTLHEVFPNQVAEDFQTLDPEVIKQRRVLEHEERHELPDGEHILAAVKFPFFGPSGEVVAVGGVDVDITEHKRAEQALREKSEFLQLTEVITRAANEAASVEAAIQMALDQVCRHTGWPVGHAYMVDEATGDLAPSGIWHLADPQQFETFRSVTEATRFASGVGLPGRVLESGEPAWIFDVTKDPNFPRAKLATEIGVRAGAAFPVLVGPKVAAVLEFFSAEALEAYEPLLEVMVQVGTQLGRVIERTRAEEAVRESEALLKTVIDNLPATVFLKTTDGKFSLVNRKYEETYDISLEAIRGKTLHDLYPKALADQYAANDQEILDELEVKYQEATVLLGDERRSFAKIMFPVFDSSGRLNSFGGVEIDITDRVRTEEELLEQKQRTEDASKLVAEKNQMLESLSNQLSKYLSPQVYASIFSGEQSVEIASKRKKLTVFFSDIANFTGTTDSLESEELTNLLNHYLTEMSKIALDHGATIDKYVGDAIIAFFGDPESRGAKEDARACVSMAIAMQRRMRELHSEWLDMGLEKPFQVRIGINTGFCTVGNFGSGDRMDYTIIGNEVNLAARLEAHAEVGGILLAHETHALVKDTVLAEEGDTLTVKGFAKPVRTYAVAGLYDDLAAQGRIIRHDQDGLALAIDRDKLTKKGRAEAIKALEAAAAQLKS